MDGNIGAQLVFTSKATATKALNDWKAIFAKDLEIIETRKLEDFT